MSIFATTVFCDDVREEKGGKISLIGCYGMDLRLIDPMPIALPKLGIVISIYVPLSEIRPLTIILRVFMPGAVDPVVVATLNVNLPAHLEKLPTEVERLGIRHVVILSPAVLFEEGFVRVTYEIDGKTNTCGLLRVITAANESNDTNDSTISAESP